MQMIRAKLAEYNAIFWKIAPPMLGLGFLVTSVLFTIQNWRKTGPDLMAPNDMPLGADFISFWSAAWLTLSGNAPGVYDDATILAAHGAAVAANTALTPYHYPPTFTLLLAPLGAMPYLTAYVVFTALTALFFLLICWRLRPGVGTLLFVSSAVPFWTNLIDGQNAFLTAGLLGLALLALPRRPVLAGTALGLLTFKPQLGLPIPLALLVARHGRAFMAAAITTILFALAALLAFGPATWMAFIHNASEPMQIITEGRIPLDRMASAFSMVLLAGGTAAAAYAAQSISLLVGFAAVTAAWSSTSQQRGSTEIKGAILTIAMLQSPPHLFHYDQPILLIALLLWLKTAEATGWQRGEKLLLLCAWLAPFVLIPSTFSTWLNPYPLFLIVLQIYLLNRLRRLTNS